MATDVVAGRELARNGITVAGTLMNRLWIGRKGGGFATAAFGKKASARLTRAAPMMFLTIVEPFPLYESLLFAMVSRRTPGWETRADSSVVRGFRRRGPGAGGRNHDHQRQADRGR
jgi:hypothetical protein